MKQKNLIKWGLIAIAVLFGLWLLSTAFKVAGLLLAVIKIPILILVHLVFSKIGLAIAGAIALWYFLVHKKRSSNSSAFDASFETGGSHFDGRSVRLERNLDRLNDILNKTG